MCKNMGYAIEIASKLYASFSGENYVSEPMAFNYNWFLKYFRTEYIDIVSIE